VPTRESFICRDSFVGQGERLLGVGGEGNLGRGLRIDARRELALRVRVASEGASKIARRDVL